MADKGDNMSEKVQINKLPVRTWNRLGVNFAELERDEREPNIKKNITIKSKEESSLSYEFGETDAGEINFEIVSGSENAEVFTWHHQGSNVKLTFDVKKNSSVRLIELLSPESGSLRSEVSVKCESGGSFSLITLMCGSGNIYSDNHIELNGDGSKTSVETAYLVKNSNTVDYNIVVNHYGKNTESRINAAGALEDNATKVFKGTIDFKTGSAGSVGSETETVIMLSDNAVNKTVPIILCSEENVEGSHGATIGELDADTLFYFESRGISREEAEKIMAYAALEHLIRLVDNSQFESSVRKALEMKTDEEM